MSQQGKTRFSNIAFIGKLSRFCRLIASYRRKNERRATCRFQVEDESAPVTIRAGAFETTGSLINISSSGAQIVTEVSTIPATVIELIFSMEEECYRHFARVVRHQIEHDRYVLTVRFEPGPFERTSEPSELPCQINRFG